MQIKLGAYVQNKLTKEIYRADYIREDGLICFRGNQHMEISFQGKDVSLVELRITPFKINSHGQVVEKRYIKARGQTYHFVASVGPTGVVHASWGAYRKGNMSVAQGFSTFPTMGLACAWLELQYVKVRVAA